MNLSTTAVPQPSRFVEMNFSACGKPPNFQLVQDVSWWVSGVLTTGTGFLGIIGNLLSLAVLCRRSMINVFHHLLAFLCLADLLFILTNLAMAPSAFNSKLFRSMSAYSECGCHFALAASVFITVSITIERYQAVCCPYNYNGRTSTRNHNISLFSYMVPCIILALVFNIPRFIVSFLTGKQLGPRLLKLLIVYQTFHPLSTTGLFPLILLGTMNYKIYSSIPTGPLITSRRRQAKNFRMARIAVALVLIFIIFNTPRLTIGIFEVTEVSSILECFSNKRIYYPSTLQLVADIISQYCALLNSSVNFIAYCMLGSQFRAEFISMFSWIVNPQMDASIGTDGLALQDGRPQQTLELTTLRSTDQHRDQVNNQPKSMQAHHSEAQKHHEHKGQKDHQHEIEVNDQPELLVDNQPEAQVDNEPGVKVPNQPEIRIHDQPEAQVDNQPKMMDDEQPEAQVGNLPEVQVDDQSKIQIDDQPDIQVNNQPEIQVEDEPEAHKDEGAAQIEHQCSTQNDQQVRDVEFEL
ncbi:FMRFamide receptor [Eurytemora carolleeae]|uniref:FMRFamide receptor n=1 Tax=Eurytemora carolleeae TaxID=1294199 RepID=UPI000C75F541|nr:FMRFamide receptor [Eurytemora carolleeae]|eukprot:XP_023330165.1 FMRFamide receptor-like [Eurytemora affinis]